MQPTKIIFTFIKSIFNEFSIVFIYILSINMFLGNVNETIKADAEGYYDYLPSIFIYHDINRKDFTIDENPSLYERILKRTVYLDYKNGYKVNKYPCGTAALQLPFFIYTSLTTDRDGSFEDGYQLPFQKTVFHAAIFYLFLGLILVKKLLELYDIKWYIIAFLQLLTTMSTAITNYANFDAGYSHIYSFFAITAFLYFTKSYFVNQRISQFLLACFMLGLIAIIRQVNVIVIFLIPFLAGSVGNLKSVFITTVRKPLVLVLGILILCSVFSIQSILWYLQTKSFLLNSYQGEGFNFLEPKFFKLLFSYRKGLFVYTPILFIALLSTFWLLFKHKYYLFTTWFFFFIFLTYILSSWWAWDYGGSYGQRVFVDYYSVFFIPFALMLNSRLNSILILFLVSLSLLTIPINLIQTFQYKRFILHWIEMDKEKYWKVFLKTDSAYNGLLWEKEYNFNQYVTTKEIQIGDLSVTKKTDNVILNINSKKICDDKKISIAQVYLENDFKEEDRTRIILRIYEPGREKNVYWHNPYLIHFAKKDFNYWQNGLYNYEFKPISSEDDKYLEIIILSDDFDNTFKNIKVKFLSHNLQ